MHKELSFSPFDSRGHLRPPESYTAEEIAELDGEQAVALAALQTAIANDDTAEVELAAADKVLRARVVDLNEARVRRATLAHVDPVQAIKAHLRQQRAIVFAAHGIPNPATGDDQTGAEAGGALPSVDLEVEQIEREVIGLRAIFYRKKEVVKQTRKAVAATVIGWRNVSGAPTAAQLHKDHAQKELRRRADIEAGRVQEYYPPSSVGPSRLDQQMAAGRGGPVQARYNSARRGGHTIENYGRTITPKLPSER